LSDDFEKAVGTDPFDPDTDGDTYNDSEELSHGYDPLTHSSYRLVKDEKFTKSLAGGILLQVEGRGEAWYVNPLNLKRHYLGRPADAFLIMRQHGLGAKHKDIVSFLANKAPRSLYGRILIDVEDSGKAYYVDYQNGSLDYLGRPDDAFSVMRKHGLGIKNNDLSRIIISVNVNE
jgi:hypothetical protein